VFGRVERPFGERLVDFAPDRGEADAERGRDLQVGDEVQTGAWRSMRFVRRAFAAASAR
jgi:hypothetical protein